MAISHKQALTITQMVYNRLPFLAETAPNTTKISQFILEVMHELDICFQIDQTNTADPIDETNTFVGEEDEYSMAQKVVIADVVSVYILMLKSAGITVGEAEGTDDGGAAGTFLKKTKAGSVEVEWDQLDTKKGGGLFTSSDALLKMYQQSARRKAKLLGCNISWDNGDMEVDCLHCTKELAPFIVTQSPDCSLDGLTPKERA